MPAIPRQWRLCASANIARRSHSRSWSATSTKLAGWWSFLPRARRCSLLPRGPSCWRRRKNELAGVAPQNNELGVMLPYTPLHHLLFAAGAPEALVMTSANRSSEPIAYEDEDALQRLSGIADAFLIGERPIARRVDDSVARDGAFGPVILRRARGYAPGAVATLPCARPILALGADLKNAITLVVDGQAFVSQHIGDLDHYDAFRAFQETVSDLMSMYEVDRDELARGARLPSAICFDASRFRASGRRGRSPCSIIARMWPRCWPSAASGRSACSE